MNALSTRAEQIAAHLVGLETGAAVLPYDTDGRQAAVDFLLEWPNGQWSGPMARSELWR